MPSSMLSDQLAYIVASVNRQLEEDLQERLRPEGVPVEYSAFLKFSIAAALCPWESLQRRP